MLYIYLLFLSLVAAYPLHKRGAIDPLIADPELFALNSLSTINGVNVLPKKTSANNKYDQNTYWDKNTYVGGLWGDSSKFNYGVRSMAPGTNPSTPVNSITTKSRNFYAPDMFGSNYGVGDYWNGWSDVISTVEAYATPADNAKINAAYNALISVYNRRLAVLNPSSPSYATHEQAKNTVGSHVMRLQYHLVSHGQNVINLKNYVPTHYTSETDFKLSESKALSILKQKGIITNPSFLPKSAVIDTNTNDFEPNSLWSGSSTLFNQKGVSGLGAWDRITNEVISAIKSGADMSVINDALDQLEESYANKLLTLSNNKNTDKLSQLEAMRYNLNDIGNELGGDDFAPVEMDYDNLMDTNELVDGLKMDMYYQAKDLVNEMNPNMKDTDILNNIVDKNGVIDPSGLFTGAKKESDAFSSTLDKIKNTMNSRKISVSDEMRIKYRRFMTTYNRYLNTREKMLLTNGGQSGQITNYNIEANRYSDLKTIAESTKLDDPKVPLNPVDNSGNNLDIPFDSYSLPVKEHKLMTNIKPGNDNTASSKLTNRASSKTRIRNGKIGRIGAGTFRK